MTHVVQLLAVGAVTGMLCACASQRPAGSVADGGQSKRNAPAADLGRTAASLRGRTKADVIAELGSATVLRFDSGYEVWAYRLAQPSARDRTESSELVLLFTPSDVVAKVRIRS
jgi:hypothetical protein